MLSRNIPHMGSHLIMDFNAIETVDLNNFDKVYSLLKNAIELSNAQIINYSWKQFEPQGITIVFTLSESHMSIHTWPEHGSCAIDFYNCGEELSVRNCQVVSQYLKKQLGESKVTSEIVIPRGQSTLIQTNNYLDKCELLKNVELLHSEQSEHQKIEVFNTQVQGKVLLLDRNIQLTDMEINNDHYTLDMTRYAVQKDQDYQNLLIIGGGDLIISAHLLKEYPRIKKITVCELDEKFYQVKKQYFQEDKELIQNSIDQNKLQLVFKEGNQFVKEQAQQNIIYDAIIIDITDYSLDSSISKNIFEREFFRQLSNIMSQDAVFTIRLSFLDNKETVTELFNSCGFLNVEVFKSPTPEYGGFLPIAVVSNKRVQNQPLTSIT